MKYGSVGSFLQAPPSVLFIVTLCCYFITAASALSVITPGAKASTLNSSAKNRLFVAGLQIGTDANAETTIEQDLTKAFQSYGAIQEVLVIGAGESSRGANLKAYAFVTFDDDASAKRALEASSTMFETVAPAQELRPRKRRMRSNAEWDQRQQLTKDCSVIIQVSKSHLERLGDFIANDKTLLGDAEVIGSFDTTSRTVSLIFIKAADPVAFIKALYAVPYVSKTALNKVYLVSGEAVDADLLAKVDDETCCNVKNTLVRHLESLVTGEKAVVRLAIFPPKVLPKILSMLDDTSFLDDDGDVTIAPTSNTHTLSVVQINPEKSTDGRPTDGGLYMLGLTESDKQVESAIREEYEEKNSDANICRAYLKLQEAFARYDQPLSPLKQNPVALDCGAAPGGWTKYLAEEFDSPKVYSVDPGDLDPSVICMDGVEHLQMTIADALPIVKKDPNGIDLWVSDMCLHNPSDQVDTLLQARDAGIVHSGTMFVLTLKFTRGHAKAAFDNQAQVELDRLEGIATGMQIIHLFSNRNGERTLMGFLN